MSAIDLSLLPSPAVIEPLSFETILAEMVTDMQARQPTWDATVESDPVMKQLEVAAYRELLVRQRINDAARAVLLASATGADLDHLAALQNVQRLLLDPGDPAAIPPVPPTYEDDDRLRRRVQMAPEGQSAAGPEGAYVFHALSAAAAVLDVSVQRPVAGEVLVTVLSVEGDGTAPPELLEVVELALSAAEVRPLNDTVTVAGAAILPYSIAATLYLYDGPDAALVLASAEAAGQAYAAASHRLGRDITLSGLYAALHRPGVQRVELTSPAASIAVNKGQAAWCTGIALVNGGVDE